MFSGHSYTSKIKGQAATLLPTRALLFWDRSRFPFPFLLNCFQGDLGRSPGALCFPKAPKYLKVGEEHLSLCSSFTPAATIRLWVHNPLGCGTGAFMRVSKSS